MTPVQSFDGLGIAPKLLEILDQLKFTVPTPIQAQAIPLAIQGQDLMGIAQTGTGKTIAFGIPVLQCVARNKKRGLILAPTRELAVQINEALLQLGKTLGLKTAVLIGGQNMGKQLQQLSRQPHVIIATPGRLIDHLERRTVKLDEVCILVLDEADRMLDMGFAPQIKRVLQGMPQARQTLLFSATMPPEIVKLANAHMRKPLRVEVAPSGTAAANVTQEIYFVRREEKSSLLEKILQEYKGSVLLFSRTKFGAKKITATLRVKGHAATEIHSNRSLNQRFDALKGFKVGKYRIMVATDIAARGIDVTGIELVLNYDLPEHPNDYIHRIGRTGRAGHDGHAISFATPEQRRDVKDIERLIKKQLTITKLPTDLVKTAPEPREDRPERHERKSFNRFDRKPSGDRRYASGPRGQHGSFGSRGSFGKGRPRKPDGLTQFEVSPAAYSSGSPARPASPRRFGGRPATRRDFRGKTSGSRARY